MMMSAALVAAMSMVLSGCMSTVKKLAVDSLFYQVKNEKPLTQADMDALVKMIKTQSLSSELSTTRQIYVVGKVATGLVQQYSQLAALAGINPSDWTVPEILSLLDEAGLIEKGEYDYLRGIDLKIFDPTEDETRVIAGNQSPLIFAIGQLAMSYGAFGK
ncbi:hypothetical protein C4J81_00200 [Deltaproteobacteria bacterium Smac51]|nr:hypothetical protein C4J81_00200 [Deltaproteobacteria bacterium Smac51]